MNVFPVSDSNQRSPLLGDAGAVSETVTPPEAGAGANLVPLNFKT